MIEEKDITDPIVKKLNKLSTEPGVESVYWRWLNINTLYGSIDGSAVNPIGQHADLARTCIDLAVQLPVDSEFAIGRVDFPESRTSARLFRVDWYKRETILVIFIRTGCNFSKSIQRSVRRIFKIRASRTL